MKDDSGKREGHSRQDRLKLALRENLKRRKSQARGRSENALAPADEVDLSLHHGGGTKPRP